MSCSCRCCREGVYPSPPLCPRPAHRDPAFANPIEIAADTVAIDREVGESDDVEEGGDDAAAASAAEGAAGKKPPQRRKRGACARVIANVCDIVGKLGP